MATRKIQKAKGEEVTPFEHQIAQAITDIETNSDNETKALLKNFKISSAKEVDLADGKKAVVVFVPYPSIREARKVQLKVVGELEKKLSGRPVLLLAQRRILTKKSKTNRVASQKRPHSRTLTSVHDAILDDIVYPSEITARRTRVRVDGSKIIKITLDPKEKAAIEQKLDSITSVYKKLTGREVQLAF